MCKYSELELKFKGLELIEVDNNNHRLNPNNPIREPTDAEIIQIRSELRNLKEAMEIENEFTLAVKRIQLSHVKRLPRDDESKFSEEIFELTKKRDVKMHATGRMRLFLLERSERIIEWTNAMLELRCMKKMAGHQIIIEREYSETIMGLFSGYPESNTAVKTAFCVKHQKLGNLLGFDAILEDCVST